MVLTQAIGGAGARSRALQCAFRLRAAPAAGSGGKKKGRGGPSAPTGPTVPMEQRVNVVLGANIFKEGSDPPIHADSEYPDWLWTLDKPLPPLSDLKRRDFKSLKLQELKRLVKLDNRQRIKDSNALKKKK
ncbi:hypothetical protein SELMODRAFT_128071 [Selaginella moellendorffii]|uniref:Large ribosomal subunit protein mL54 n=1 Tax=Selaginella moellendorffii TaxID=88036 RepID=D8SYP3_SELML|nr:hypothetical protein SELMODRAFT_128071 [Selaginella moellendorffii]